jgi:hypothetical protein
LLSDRHRAASPIAPVVAIRPEVHAAAVQPAVAAERTGFLVLVAVLVGGAVAVLLRRRRSAATAPEGAQW